VERIPKSICFAVLPKKKGGRKGRREGRRDGGREREKQSVIELPGLGDFLQKGNTRPLNELSSP
jgi:hypothetical protein